MTRHVLRLAALAVAIGTLAVAPAAVAGELERVEAWLDAPVPTDAAPGTTVTIGVTIWHATEGTPFLLPAIVIEPYDRSDPATPLEAIQAPTDWPGHYVAEVAIPPGGLDHIVVGLPGRSCTAEGECVESIISFDEGGVGPPPEAPLPFLADLQMDLLTTPAIAGEPIDVELTLEHRAPWSRDLAPYPEELVVMLRPPRAEPLTEAVAALADPDTGRYAAAIPAPEPGDYVIDAATDPETTTGEIFTRATQRVTVEPPEAAPVPANDEAAIDPALIAAIVAAVVAVGSIGIIAIRRLG